MGGAWQTPAKASRGGATAHSRARSQVTPALGSGPVSPQLTSSGIRVPAQVLLPPGWGDLEQTLPLQVGVETHHQGEAPVKPSARAQLTSL